MRILVDGDACPVKKEVCRIAADYDLKVIIFQSTAHWSIDKSEAEYITVDSSYQAVDIKIINQVKKGDIVISNDYGLVSLVLKKDAYALSSYGKIFSEEIIDYLLAKRHFSAKLRRQGKYLSGPSKYSREDRDNFKHNLISLIEKIR